MRICHYLKAFFRFRQPLRLSLTALTVLLAIGALLPGRADAGRPPQPVVFEELGRLKSIEVHPVESGRFSLDHRTPPPPEIAEYVRTTLQNENRLRYASPGEGVLSLRCENDRCSRIRAEVRTRTEDGQADGPVVWHTVRKYRPGLFHFLPDPQRFAQDIAARLTNDYEQSLRALPLKIEINEE